MKAKSSLLLIGLILAAVLVYLFERQSVKHQAGHAVSSLSPVKVTRSGSTANTAATRIPFFVHYYIWWDTQHWRAKLGPDYPYTLSKLPVPARLAEDGCTATAAYQNDELIDIPAPPLGLYSQDDPQVFDQHIRDAADAGISGFVVSWAGNGQANQTNSSTSFNHRLDILVHEVNRYNETHRVKFLLMLGYEGLNNAREPRPVSWVRNDLQYFFTHYVSNAAFQIPYYQNRTVIMLLDSRKFTPSDIGSIAQIFSDTHRDHLYFIGDEHGEQEWARGVSGYFDGDGWYWSDENPDTNPGAFKTIQKLANVLKSQHKLWFAPLNGGYNKSNFHIGGSCIPRKNGETMKRIYEGNKASHPDGWMYISWNEFFENTYMEPSVQYGKYYLDQLKAIISKQ